MCIFIIFTFATFFSIIFAQSQLTECPCGGPLVDSTSLSKCDHGTCSLSYSDVEFEVLLQKLRRAREDAAASFSIRQLKANFTPSCVRMDLTKITDQIVITVYDPLNITIHPRSDDTETNLRWTPPQAFGKNLQPTYCSLRDERAFAYSYGNPCLKHSLGNWNYQTCWYQTTEESLEIASATDGSPGVLSRRRFANFLLFINFLAAIRMAFLT